MVLQVLASAFCCGVLFTLVASSSAFSSLCSKSSGWTVIVDEDFSGPQLNKSLWSVKVAPGGLVYFSPYNIDIDGGNLLITTRREVYRDLNFTSGWVDTQALPFKYGRVCVQAAFPSGKPGLLPLHALYPATDSCYDGRSAITFASMSDGSGVGEGSVQWLNNVIVSNTSDCHGTTLTCSGAYLNKNFSAMHEYGVEWSENELVFYVDGDPYMTCYPQTTEHTSVLNHEMVLALTTRLSASVSDQTVFPQEQYVDYVRVLQKDAAAAATITRLKQWNV